MDPSQILIVEDEEDILALVHFNLSRAGYRTLCATSGEEGLHLARTEKPDLILLDLMLPGMDGLAVCQALKEDDETGAIGVIMLTAKGEETDVIAGLEMGADDYITKPFSNKVLQARIQAVLRRAGDRQPAVSSPEEIQFPDLSIHVGRNEVLVEGKRVELTYTEFNVLVFLAGRPGWVFTRYQIVNGVRGDGYAVTDRAVDVQIAGLRKKLGRCGHYVETVRGVGYRFRDPATP